MTVLMQPMNHPAAWRGQDMRASQDWIYRVTEADIGELEQAGQAVVQSGRALADVTRADFPLTHFAATIGAWVHDLELGRGFVLIKGLPVDRWGESLTRAVYWGLGLYMGTAVSQNKDGDVLGDVRDTGADPADPDVRLYKTSAAQSFHTDGADIIGLLCLKPSKSGGLSRIVSSAAIYNTILAERPDIIPVLYENFCWDTQGEHQPGQQPWFEMPICTSDGKMVQTLYIDWYLRDALKHDGVPPLKPLQADALDWITRLAHDPDYYLDMDFEPGDIQFLKNAVILHARTAYEDFPEPERRRHLLRLWLTSDALTGGNALLRDGVPVADTA